MVWLWLLLKKFHCKALSLTVRSVVSSLSFVTPFSNFPLSMCNYLSFRASVFLCLLLDLDTNEGLDPLGAFPLFLKKVAGIIATKLSVIFRGLIRLGSLPECWCLIMLLPFPRVLNPMIMKTTDPYQ